MVKAAQCSQASKCEVALKRRGATAASGDRRALRISRLALSGDGKALSGV
jgi:hypothetical protein